MLKKNWYCFTEQVAILSRGLNIETIRFLKPPESYLFSEAIPVLLTKYK